MTAYVLLDEFKTYGPLIVVKGTPMSLCCCREELQSIIHDGWTVWELPLPKYWEIPPRNDDNRAKRRAQFPQVAEEHWGEDTGAGEHRYGRTYWVK